MSERMVEVAVALVHRHGFWLVARRPQSAHLGGLWEFPGGKIQPGEAPVEAALRELHEECGVHAAAERTLPTFRHDYDECTVQLTPIVCRWVAGEPAALASQECRWVDLAELRELAMPAMNAEVIRVLAASTSP
jgi:8-oxo-dGTP diphosphatase